jgi:hypothetical protein
MDVDVGSFSQGYVAGWRSVTGDVPVLVPESPVLVGAHVGAVTYMVCFSRGARDATAMTPEAADFRTVNDRAGRRSRIRVEREPLQLQQPGVETGHGTRPLSKFNAARESRRILSFEEMRDDP